MRRKSQSISINTIIVAAIALAVLVVLFMIFTGRFKIFSEGLEKTGLSCSESCKLGNYRDGSPSFGSCDKKIGGSFSDVDSKQNQVCCCVS